MKKKIEKKIDARFPFLNIETLMIFFCLLYSKKLIEVPKFIYTRKFNTHDNFSEDLSKFPEYKLGEVVKFTETAEHFKFELVKERKEELIKFLQDYINLYKSGKLKSADIYNGKKVNYYTYERNLVYVQKVVEYYEKDNGYDFSINIGDICHPECGHSQCDINIRFLEFIIEVYLQKTIYKSYFKINTCKSNLTSNFLNKRIFLDMDVILSENYYKIFEKLKESMDTEKVQQKKSNEPKIYNEKDLIEEINLKRSIKQAVIFSLKNNNSSFDIQAFSQYYNNWKVANNISTNLKKTSDITLSKYLNGADRALREFLPNKKQKYIYPQKFSNEKTGIWHVDIPVKTN